MKSPLLFSSTSCTAGDRQERYSPVYVAGCNFCLIILLQCLLLCVMFVLWEVTYERSHAKGNYFVRLASSALVALFD